MAKKQEEEIKEEGLLRQLCGEDVKMYECLTNHLYENPSTALSDKDITTLTGEAEQSGRFGPALDKAIFEATQNPGEGEKYAKIIKTLALKSSQKTEQEKEKAKEESLTDRVALLEKRIENQKLLADRTEDALNIATRFYTERLAVGEADGIRDARVRVKNLAERQEMRDEDQERAKRKARLREIKAMGRKERKIALKEYKAEGLAAAAAKEAREKDRNEFDDEERRLDEVEQTAREERKKERS